MILATSIDPSCSSSNTTTRLEEWLRKDENFTDIHQGLTASVEASEVLVPKGSVSGTSRPKFPPRRPIQRALSVSEEDLIPISDLILLTEYPVSPLHNPIAAFHEATNYVYFPTPTTEYIDKNQNALISAASPPLSSSVDRTQGRRDAGGLLIATVKSFAERTVHFLYQLIPMKGGWTRWCSSAKSEGAQEQQSVQSFCGQDWIDPEARSSLLTDPGRNSAEFWHLEPEEDEGYISDIGSPIVDDFLSPYSYSPVELDSSLEDEDEVCVLLQEGANLLEELTCGLDETSTNEPCSQSVGLDCQIVFPPTLTMKTCRETDSSNSSELDWDGNYADKSSSVSWDRISVPRTFPVGNLVWFKEKTYKHMKKMRGGTTVTYSSGILTAGAQ
ncbi:hypothetical protein F5876DRAFT_66178 [Lentinula aff. lateritia]|uniref:Uncharacterized protein n=1 Tax=Lentinula aff. lateritia TaxID=2804960 RepID=A0ACC1TYY2_9AGAR|nr:hypothetical protein F5876DRAFT_66178 [Lentinula aff. lateritia]